MRRKGLKSAAFAYALFNPWGSIEHRPEKYLLDKALVKPLYLGVLI
jgi:hypothetical protein